MGDCRTCRQIKLVTFILLSSFTYCHYIASPDSIIRGVLSNGKHLLTRRNAEKSLKIMVHTDDSVQKLSSNTHELIIERLLPDAVEYFGKTLSVRQRISPIRLQRECEEEKVAINGTLFRYCIGPCSNVTKCGVVQVPEAHLETCRKCHPGQVHCTDKATSTGITDTDFVLYISAVATLHCNDRGDVLAYAATCQQEQNLDRPVAGFVNFCSDKLTRNLHYTHLLAVVKHEIFHALGFSSSFYGYYRADDGTPLTTRLPDGRPTSKWSDKVVKEITRDDWQVSLNAGSSVNHEVQMIVTARVVNEVRVHFNCPTLEGAEIENQGGLGQRHTHLEKRVFENEAMTGVFTNNPVFSRITLALMEDTGWYKANYKMAEHLDWGHKAGCLFVQNSCKAWMDFQKRNNNSISPYCSRLPSNSHTQTGCTHNRQGVGICNLIKHKTPLPIAYQYFSSRYYGGARALADYCPYFQELDWKQNGVTVRGSSCKHKSNNPKKNYAAELYGDDSACFVQGKAWRQRSCSHTVTAVDWGSGCYSYACSFNGLVISISGHSYQCLYAEQTLDVNVVSNKLLHEGSILCPSCKDLCGGLCPMVERTFFYNSSLSENSDVLVCSSVSLYQNPVSMATLAFVSTLLVRLFP